MTPAEKKRADELTAEIEKAKQRIMSEQRYMGNAKKSTELTHIGELVNERNVITGENADVKYFFLDDGEWYYDVVGFVGDDAGRKDINGTDLKIGDTVEIKTKSGNLYPRLILSIFLQQDELNETEAVKTKDYTDLDIKDTNNAAFTITENSCLERYLKTQEPEMTMSM